MKLLRCGRITSANSLALAGLLGLFAVSPAFADSVDKLDARLRLRLENTTGANVLSGSPGENAPGQSDIVDVFVRGDLDEGWLRQNGAEPGTVIGDIATARVPLAAVNGLANSPRVHEIRLAQPVVPLLDRNRIETEVTEMWGADTPPVYPPSGYTGQGVIVGVVDTGIDLNHQDFRTATGATRILSLWDQNPGSTPPPSGFTYGQEWNSAQINAGGVPEYDYSGHGTHVAGAAAGNGRATGNGFAAYRYVGMAPEADLVIVKLNGGNDAQVLDAISYIFRKADAAGKDAVVCVAVGKQAGPHDGTDPLDQAIDALSGPGHIVVAAAGNDGKTKIHSRLRLSPNVSGTASFTVPTYQLIGNPYINMEGWFNQGQNVTVKLTSPAGFVLGPLNMGQNGSMSNTDGWALIQWTVPASGAREIFCTIQPPGAGEWKIEVKNVGTGTAAVDFWLSGFILSQNKVPTMLQAQNDSSCIASPGTANSVLTASAYCAKKSWVSQTGQNMSYTGAVLGTIADFSSFGPRRDGVPKPDIAGSGYGMASARSANATFAGTSVVDDGVHVMMTGTSTAAAAAAGAVALLLEEFPGLDPASARSILQSRANKDANTGTMLPTPRWGWGKLAIGGASASGVGDIPTPGAERLDVIRLGAPYPNPVHDLTRVPFALEKASDVKAAIYDVQGREVRLLHSGSLDAGDHSLTWDGRDNENRVVSSGQYYLVVSSRSARQSRAISLVK